MKIDLKLQLICGLVLFFLACSPLRNSSYDQYVSLKAETSECLTNYTYTNTLIASGSAKFFKRGINLVVETGALKNMTLGDPLADALPIRYAEIAVYNSTNQLVQCGLTDASGNLKALNGSSDLLIPAVKDSYTFRVLARMNGPMDAPVASPTKPSFTIHVAVKKDIYTNEVHYISKTLASTGSADLNNVDLIAYARQTESLDVEGGAFNILNSIFIAYDYIRNHTGTVDTTCLSEKLNVYWKLGFNPFQYTYPSSNPSYISNGSFYNPSESNLYITGGRLGDISIDITNHFDDFVIIHELGHHIENKCGQLLSPGGSHSILARIDPRLAWAEGWSNYFAGQVMFTSLAYLNPEVGLKLTAAGLSSNWTYLFASKGFSDSIQNIGNGDGFMFDMKKSGNNPDTWQYGDYKGNSFDKVDPNRYPGEGHFREGAISRGLFKLTNNCGGTCITTTPITFENIWKSVDKITGVGQVSYPFKGSSDVLEKLKTSSLASGDWTTNFKNFNQQQTSEALHLFSDGIFTSGGINRWIPYGTYLTNLTGGACAVGQMYIEPRLDDPVLTSTNSDQRYSNHFYTLDLSLAALSSVDELTVTFTKQNSSGTTTEFDLLLFQENYFYNGDYSCSTTDSAGNCTAYVASRSTNSDVLRSDRRSGVLASKTIRNLLALDHSKRYLLNIRAYTPSKTTISPVTDYSYVITEQMGQKVCP